MSERMSEPAMKQYAYRGPIMVFDKCADPDWYGVTTASTKAKARTNLTYQAKQLLGKEAWTRVTLPGEIKPLK